MKNEKGLLGGVIEPGYISEAEEDLDAAVYARTSSKSQNFGYSIDGQVRKCWDRCQSMGWNVTHIFCDEAISGKDMNRPMFQQLLSKAEAGLFDVVVIWKLDRFSRSLLHAVQLENEFREWGIALHSITEQIDTTTPAGRFNFRSISSAAEFERDLSKQRSRMGMNQLALERKWPNDLPPLGYNKCEDGTLEVNPDESTLVVSIFTRYKELQSMPKLASELNEQGYLTKQNNKWTARGVADILQNELYVGDYSVADVEEHVPDYQIVDRDLFNTVTDIRNRFRRNESCSSKKEMSKTRKEQRVNIVNEQFRKFINQQQSDDS